MTPNNIMIALMDLSINEALARKVALLLSEAANTIMDLSDDVDALQDKVVELREEIRKLERGYD